MYMVKRRRMRDVEQSYRLYVTDMLRNIPQGKYLSKRWADVIRPSEDFDPDDIIDHVIARISEE